MTVWTSKFLKFRGERRNGVFVYVLCSLSGESVVVVVLWKGVCGK